MRSALLTFETFVFNPVGIPVEAVHIVMSYLQTQLLKLTQLFGMVALADHCWQPTALRQHPKVAAAQAHVARCDLELEHVAAVRLARGLRTITRLFMVGTQAIY